MQFDAALAAQESFGLSEEELGSDWNRAVELESIFSSQAGPEARKAYDALLELAQRHPLARSFHAFCIFITWQQVTEETISHHFQTGVRLCESYLASPKIQGPDLDRVKELYGSFRAGLGLEEEDEVEAEYRRDTPKGGD